MYKAGKIRMRLWHDQRGITLAEILVAISIMGIIAVFATPNVREFILNNQQITSMNEYIGFLNFARSEAIKGGSPVTVCKSANGASCAGGGVNWENGWLAFQDVNSNGAVDGGEAILRYHVALSSTLTMRGNANVVNRVTFNSRGYSPGSAGTLRLCDNRGVSRARAVVIAISGRIRRAVDGNGDGIVEDGGGTNVPCP